MFKSTHKDIGKVKVGSTNTIYFEYDQIGKIIELRSPCDCSHPGNEPENNRIVVIYKARAVPEHLKKMGKTQYAIRKEIKVRSLNTDGTEDITTLVFTGTVKQ